MALTKQDVEDLVRRFGVKVWPRAFYFPIGSPFWGPEENYQQMTGADGHIAFDDNFHARWCLWGTFLPLGILPNPVVHRNHDELQHMYEGLWGDSRYEWVACSDCIGEGCEACDGTGEVLEPA